MDKVMLRRIWPGKPGTFSAPGRYPWGGKGIGNPLELLGIEAQEMSRRRRDLAVRSWGTTSASPAEGPRPRSSPLPLSRPPHPPPRERGTRLGHSCCSPVLAVLPLLPVRGSRGSGEEGRGDEGFGRGVSPPLLSYPSPPRMSEECAPPTRRDAASLLQERLQWSRFRTRSPSHHSGTPVRRDCATSWRRWRRSAWWISCSIRPWWPSGSSPSRASSGGGGR